MSLGYRVFYTCTAVLMLGLAACAQARISLPETQKEPDQPQVGDFTVIGDAVAMSLDAVEDEPRPPQESQEGLAPADEAEAADLADLERLLLQVIEDRDFDLMQSLMSDSFGFAGWGSGGWVYSPAAAIEQIRLNYLGSDHVIRFQEAPDLGYFLGGRDILSVWNPAANPIKALFSIGWGPEGKDEAFLIITQPDDTPRWGGILYAHATSGGFSGDLGS